MDDQNEQYLWVSYTFDHDHKLKNILIEHTYLPCGSIESNRRIIIVNNSFYVLF